MGCFSGFAKYILFFFNFVIVVCGVVLIAIGGVLIYHENKGIDGVTDYSVGGFAIGVGAVIFCIAFFGCCGAIKQNSCLLTTYAVILIVLLVLQVVLGVLAFIAVRNDDSALDTKVQDVVKKVFNKYYESQTKEQRDIIDTIQETFKCCGINSSVEYADHNIFTIPSSCYEDSEDKTTEYEDGCAKAFQDFITYNIKVIGGIAIGFAVVELIAAIFACIVRNKKY